jgi:molybdopterin-guanine dinucleotide biosynthesis protein A
MPNLSVELLQELWKYTENTSVVVPEHPDGRLEPLCALYSERILSLVESAYEANPSLSLHSLLKSLRACRVPQSVWEKLPGGPRLFENINTQDDLTRHCDDPV